jgi:hypothetical protein
MFGEAAMAEPWDSVGTVVTAGTHLLAAQREIETLRIQLWNLDATI